MADFVIRLVNDQHTVLAWARVRAVAKPQGRARCEFWPESEPTKLVTTEAGVASGLSIHWTDYDVAKMVTLPAPVSVIPGLVFDFKWSEPVWVVKGQDIPLHGVTVAQRIEIGPPSGTLSGGST